MLEGYGNERDEKHGKLDQNFDMRPVRDSSRKKLEPQRTYTMINREHLTTHEDRQRELDDRSSKFKMEDDFEMIVSPLNSRGIAREI